MFSVPILYSIGTYTIKRFTFTRIVDAKIWYVHTTMSINPYILLLNTTWCSFIWLGDTPLKEKNIWYDYQLKFVFTVEKFQTH